MEKNEAIAIIGASCRFPKNVSSIEDYWEFLKNGEDAVSETPQERWSWRFHYDKNPDMPGKVYVKRGSYMNIDIEAFDAAFFDISPREASVLDPQQRLLLELSFEALEDAVGNVNTLQGSNTGVYIGCFMQDNLHTQSGPGAKTQVSLHTAVSSTMTMVSNRLSYTFDLKGPSFTLDTACSSSLVAVHQACLGLRVHDCDMAIAGGVNVMFRPEPNIMMCKGHFLSADGRSKTFSAHADGYGRGEGAGIVVLKRLKDALNDGDTIHGVILSSGVNQDGSTEGITVPSETSQIALANKVYKDGNIDPKDITYLEAHGTGTPVGDPIEMRAMGTAISRGHHDHDEPLIVGSVKAGIGHLEAAAGIAGLLKAMLVAKHGHIPPQAWLDTELNPAIDFEGLNIRIAEKYQPLPKSKTNGRSYIAVNSFGYGGTNAHAVVAPFDPVPAKPVPSTVVEPARPHYCLFLSGASESACEAYAKLYLEMMTAASDEEVLNICRNAVRKTALSFRWVITAASAAELREKLTEVVNGARVAGVIKGRANSQQQPVFVFSGMGPQWWAMGQQLFQTEPIYAKAVTEADKIFQELAGWSILAEMLRHEEESKMAETAIAQTANFIVQMGIFELLASWGIKPAAVVGHSVGEVSSAYASGVLSLRDAITVSYHRGRTQAKTAGTGSMLATGLSLTDAEQAITVYEGKVSIAGINSPTNCTLSGDEACIDMIAAQLESQGVFNRKLRVEVPYHSAGMDPILDELRSSLHHIKPGTYPIPLYSTVTGGLAGEGAFGSDYWCDNVRHPVLFKKAIESILADGYEALLEIGPHPVLTGYVKEIMSVAANKGVCLTTLKRKEDESAQLREAVAGLWVNGVNWELRNYLGTFTKKRVLPSYPWQRKTHWREDKNERLKRQGWPDAHVLLGHRTADPVPTWHSELTGAIVPWLEAHRVGQQTVFPGAGYLDVMTAVLQEQNQLLSEKALRNIHFHRAMVIPEGEWLAMKTILDNSGKVSVYAGIASRINEWTLHASAEFVSGKFSPPASHPGKALDLEAFENVDVQQLYQKLNSLGLDYGKTFQTIKRLRKQETQAYLELETDCQCDHFIHPALLDGAFQAMLALSESQTAYLPVGIKEIRFYEKLPARCQAFLEITQRSERTIQANVTLFQESRVCCEVRGIRCDAVQLVADPVQKAIDSMTYRANWIEVGYSDSQVVLPKVALVGSNIPTELKDALMANGTEKIERYPSIDDLVQHCNVSGVDLIALFVNSPSAESAMKEAVDMVLGLQQLAKRECKASVVLVTEQAMAEEIRHSQNGWLSAWCIGVRRNASNELTSMTFRNIDVTDLAEDSYMLAAEMTAANAPDEVALFARNRYAIQVATLETSDYVDMTVKMREQFKDQGKNNFNLHVPARPSIQNLVFSKTERQAPAEYEIEIRVDFVSINYKDLAKVVGMLTEEMMANVNSGMTLGLECTGEVVAIGEKVKNYKLGDKVVAGKTDCFSRYVLLNTNREQLPATPVLPLPRNHSMAEGAVMFVAYLTSLWGLKHMANLMAGETVLIHGAAGGVGVAAVILAKQLGACVIAAAGTEAKRDYLKHLGADYTLDSRTLNFGNEVMAITGGRGVDVVFNSVGGGVVPVSFEILADLGRFVEIGKADIYSKGALSLVPFDRGICYYTLDLDFLVTRNRKKYFALIDEVWELVDSGYLKPLPVTVFGADEIVDAFSYLSKSKQIGKVAIDCSQLPWVSSVSPRNKALSPEKTVLITGGLGGVGLMYADWLVDQGVRKLALLGRKGAHSDEAKSAVAALQARGMEVEVYACDVSDQLALKKVIDTIQQRGILGSVVHAAGVLNDKAFQEMNVDAITQVASPKMLGAYNLHVLTKDNPELEMFLVVSSVSAVTGNTFQVNYCLANTFIDGLIEYRVSQGLPGNSLQLGAVAGVGMAQSSSDVERYLKTIGINTFDLSMMHATFQRIYQWNMSTLSLMDVDWPVWEYAETGASSAFRFKEIISRFGSGSQNTSIKSTLLLMPKEERIETLGFIVAEHLANILQMNAEEVDLLAPLESFGIDSITAVELQMLINRSLQIDLSILALLSSKSLIHTATEISALIEQDQTTGEALNPAIAEIVSAAMDGDVKGKSSEGEPA